MIETKFFKINDHKELKDAALELDKLTNYEGWNIVCCVGRKNDVLVLRRQFEYPQEMQPTPMVQEETPTRKGGRPAKRFPNAVHR